MEEGAGAVVGRERECRPPAAVAPVEPGVRRDRDEAREGLRMVADVVVDDRQPVEPRGAIARDRHDGRVRQLRDHGGCLSGRRGGDRERTGQRCEELAALVERDWV